MHKPTDKRLLWFFLPKIGRRIRIGLNWGKKKCYICFWGIFIIAKSKKYCIFFKIVVLFLFIVQKKKKRRGDQISPKESSICGKKRTPILFGSHVARPRNCQLKQRSAESQKGAWSFSCILVRVLKRWFTLQNNFLA